MMEIEKAILGGKKEENPSNVALASKCNKGECLKARTTAGALAGLALASVASRLNLWGKSGAISIRRGGAIVIFPERSEEE